MAVTLHTTLGDIKIELETTEVPTLCENFLACAASGMYDGTQFHRLIPSFIAQAGDPTHTGKGGHAVLPSKNEKGYLPDVFSERLKHSERGVVSMANNGKDTNGSQFFITFAPAPTLDNVYCVIGKVLDGFDVLDSMERVPVGAKHRPVTPIVINSVTIHANPFAPI